LQQTRHRQNDENEADDFHQNWQTSSGVPEEEEDDDDDD
jgi:hypothetical protein